MRKQSKKDQNQTETLQLYQPHAAQLAFHASNARFRVAAWGRQAGKSTACINELLKRAWEYPGGKFWFISPTFSQAQIQYRRAVGALWNCDDILLKKNQTELRIKLIQHSEIVFKSGEVFDNLRGESLHGVVIDEVRDQPPELWNMIIRPMLTTTKGWAAFVSTPKGYDKFYDLAKQAQEDTTGEWDYFCAPSTCNPLFSQEEFEAAKKEMTEDEFAQEILAEFKELYRGAAYQNFSRDNISTCNPWLANDAIYSPQLPIVLGCDFNVDPMAWVLGQTSAGRFYFFEEILLKRSNTIEAAKELIARLKKYEIKHNPQVIICGDASGKATRSTSAGETDYTLLCQVLDAHKITWQNRTPDSNPSVKDRINTVNAKLKNAEGKSTLFFHPNCKASIRDCERVAWKQGAEATLDKSDLTLTHMSDAFGYPIVALDPLRQNGQVGKMRVITR